MMRARRAKRCGVGCRTSPTGQFPLLDCGQHDRCGGLNQCDHLLALTLPGRKVIPVVPLSTIAPFASDWQTGLVPASRRRPDVSWLPTVVPTLQTLLDAGEATHGLNVIARGGHLVIGRTDEYGADPRFRLTPLGAGAYGLSLYRRIRWEPLPFEGSLQELADAMNHELSTWADDWS